MSVTIFSLVLLALAASSVHSSPMGICPAVDPEQNSAFLPDDAQCKKFYMCEAGKAFEYTCPAGLYFNPELNVCDYPENAGCKSADAYEEIEAVRALLPRPPPTAFDWLCLTASPRRLHLPNPWDSHKFFKCDHGHATQFLCPSGLVFNHRLQVCDWPQAVNHVYPDASSSFHVCRYATRHHFHFPYFWDSHKFIECDLNTRKGTLMSCSADLVFNPFLQVCDYSWKFL